MKYQGIRNYRVRQDLCGKTFTIGYDNDTKKIENKEKFRVIATMGRL